MFEKMYSKFLRTIKEFDLISDDMEKVVIASSGGKDANTMTTFLLEYKLRERPDLEIEIVNVVVPEWKYDPEKYYDRLNEAKKEILVKEREHIDVHRKYWEDKGVSYVELRATSNIDDDKIFASNSPCLYCFISTKKTLFNYLYEQNKVKNTALAYGLTKWDILYVMSSQMLRSNGMRWEELKESNPEKYRLNCNHLASFCPYPKIEIGIPEKKVYCIEPIIEFSDLETKECAKVVNAPIIPDVCCDLYGDRFQSEKRNFDKFMLKTAKEEINLLNTIDPLFSDYNKLLEMFTSCGILPPREELSGVLYDTYFNNIMDAIIVE